MARLSFVDSKGDTLFAKIGSDHPEVIIGRAKSCTLRIHHKSVSSRHCKVVFLNDSFSVKDLGSTNGTFYQGKKTQGFALPINEEFTCGTVLIRLDAPSSVLDIKTVVGIVDIDDGLKKSGSVTNEKTKQLGAELQVEAPETKSEKHTPAAERPALKEVVVPDTPSDRGDRGVLFYDPPAQPISVRIALALSKVGLASLLLGGIFFLNKLDWPEKQTMGFFLAYALATWMAYIPHALFNRSQQVDERIQLALNPTMKLPDPETLELHELFHLKSSLAKIGVESTSHTGKMFSMGFSAVIMIGAAIIRYTLERTAVGFSDKADLAMSWIAIAFILFIVAALLYGRGKAIDTQRDGIKARIAELE